MATELVPVKTKYPGIPPAFEPLWLHLDWIQTTAASLDEWAELAERRKRWRGPSHPGAEVAHSPWIQMEMERWNFLWREVVPLFDHFRLHFPLEVWGQFKNIRTPHDAERKPDEAVAEWARLRDYAVDRLVKLLGSATAVATAGNQTAVRDGESVKPDPVAPDVAPSGDGAGTGPAAPNLFWHGGESTTLEPVPWRLLDYSWRNRTSKEADVIEAVWENHGRACAETDGPLKSAIKKANKALDRVSCPMHLGRKNGYVMLA